MANLLDETMADLKAINKTENDVLWVGSDKIRISWKKFVELANTEYDSGFGAPEVAMDLLIVGSDWWLERDEYDGSENWILFIYPKMPKDVCEDIKALTIRQAHNLGIKCSCGWESFMILNNIKEITND